VGCRGGGGGVTVRGAGRSARTANTFCVFLTLETVVFFGATFFVVAFAGDFAVTLVAGFLDLAARFCGVTFLAVALGAAFALAVLFLGAVLAAVARFAFGFEADLALTARFAALEEVRFAAVRPVDRRKPFERLLLILVRIYKGC
jgi:hypothetical protein